MQDALPAQDASALLLSGGLDSSVVAALAAPRAPDLQAIAAAFPEPELDETTWARRVADTTGIALTTVPIEQREPLDAAEALPARTGSCPCRRPGSSSRRR